jgi:hypothetical protein
MGKPRRDAAGFCGTVNGDFRSAPVVSTAFCARIGQPPCLLNHEEPPQGGISNGDLARGRGEALIIIDV